MISLEGLNDFHGFDFANAKSGKKKSKKETALAGSNPCDIPEIALESCSMRLNPVLLVSCTSLVLLFNVSKKGSYRKSRRWSPT